MTAGHRLFRLRPAGMALTALIATTTVATAQEATADAAAADNITAVTRENGRWYTADGVPTYKIEADGTLDWATYSGFRRYHSECHVCHGPEGEGSSYAPALKNSAVAMDYYDFIGVVADGRQKVNAAQTSVMPSFGTNVNVMCYLDDIYTYLKARGTDAVPRGRPAKREEKPEEIRAAEAACLGT